MSLLYELRRLAPARPLTAIEAYSVAERQATLLLQLSNVTEAPVPSQVVSGLPFIKVAVRMPMASSGASKWIKPRWVVLLNGLEPPARQRFSLAHELKHVIDHKTSNGLWRPWAENPIARRRIEQLCDYFAGCLLMPRPWVKAAYCGGTQDVVELAKRFQVSPQAMQVRLLQLGLIEPYERCGSNDLYFRSASSSIELAA
jgi:Zn-dependent peptidase ImmA (M78 family)